MYQTCEAKFLAKCCGPYCCRFLTDAGIDHLREYLNLPAEIVPATLKKSSRPLERGDRYVPFLYLKGFSLVQMIFLLLSVTFTGFQRILGYDRAIWFQSINSFLPGHATAYVGDSCRGFLLNFARLF